MVGCGRIDLVTKGETEEIAATGDVKNAASVRVISRLIGEIWNPAGANSCLPQVEADNRHAPGQHNPTAAFRVECLKLFNGRLNSIQPNGEVGCGVCQTRSVDRFVQTAGHHDGDKVSADCA